MAIAVIGGLITSTLLSLLVVPAVFTYVDDFKLLLDRGVRRMRHPHGGAVKDRESTAVK
jgi:predicted RND superfamily exporter protein